jgi:hypothetical protein
VQEGVTGRVTMNDLGDRPGAFSIRNLDATGVWQVAGSYDEALGDGDSFELVEASIYWPGGGVKPVDSVEVEASLSGDGSGSGGDESESSVRVDTVDVGIDPETVMAVSIALSAAIFLIPCLWAVRKCTANYRAGIAARDLQLAA